MGQQEIEVSFKLQNWGFKKSTSQGTAAPGKPQQLAVTYGSSSGISGWHRRWLRDASHLSQQLGGRHNETAGLECQLARWRASPWCRPNW